MPCYPQSAVTAKSGVNHVRATVERAGSVFIKIDQDSDLGIDALIDLVQDGKPLNKQLAIQIKSGQSYYDSDGGECLFPIGTHRDYWLQYALPVYGVVYVPTLKTAYWVNIKRFLKAHPDASMIRYPVSEANRFDGNSFIDIFIPGVVHKDPTLPIDKAFRLIRSTKLDEAYLAITVLFRRHPNVLQVWDEFIHFLRERPSNEIPGHLVYFLAHIPWHGDIFAHGEQLSPATRQYARQLTSRLDYEDVLKLLSLIDRENSISRGSLGQSVEAIVSSLPTASALLREIASTAKVDMFVRECAALILAMNEGLEASSVLEGLAASGSWYAREIHAHLTKWGHINPYA